MKKIAAVYTVPSVYASFPALIRETLGAETRLVNTVDEYLASDPAEKGVFTTVNLNRLLAILRNAELTQPDAIVVTCSTLSPPVETLRPLISVPIVTIDGAMLRKAVDTGSRITVVATAKSTVEPAWEGLRREAGKKRKAIDVDVVTLDDAYEAIKKLDRETHDRIVLEAAGRIHDRDVVLLAQASMAHLEEQVHNACAITTLSSPGLCMEELKEIVGLRRN